VCHDLSRDFSVREDDDAQRHDPAPNPQDENEHFRFQIVCHVVESAAGQIALCVPQEINKFVSSSELVSHFMNKS
jgi:hypothetical protein